MEDPEVPGGPTIPAAELAWRFETSGGPGGQHANRNATVAVLSYDVGSSRAFDEPTRARIMTRLGSRVSDGVVTVSEGSSRSQWTNRQRARARLSTLLSDALRVDSPRIRTAPPAGARRRRLQAKRLRGEVKRLRRRPGPED